MDTPNLDDLQTRLEKMLSLLKDPHPGLMSWDIFYGEAFHDLLDFWNDDDEDDDDKDWTEKDGVSNSSDRYLSIVNKVMNMLSRMRLGCALETEARAIVSTLVHKEGLAPKEE